MKKILIVTGIIIVVVVAALIIVLTSLDRIVTAAIERYGSMATQTDVKVSGVNISLKSGEGSIKGLRIGNPSGFSSPDAFSLGDVSVKIDTSTVTEDIVVIDRIRVARPSITYEINESGEANINAIKKNIERLKGEAAPADTPQEKEKAGAKLLIRQFEIEDGQVDVLIPVKKEPMTVKMPRVEIANLGSGGASPADIAAQVLTILVKNTAQAAGKAGVDQYIGKSLEEMKGRVREQLDEKVGEAVEETSKKAEEAVKKFLGK